MEDENIEDFDRCAKCNRPFIEGETAYHVCELPLGWRDKDTPCFTVCEECYLKYYGWNNLLTVVHVE